MQRRKVVYASHKVAGKRLTHGVLADAHEYREVNEEDYEGEGDNEDYEVGVKVLLDSLDMDFTERPKREWPRRVRGELL